MKTIIDEFTHIKSKQVRYQLRNLKKGLCWLCSNKRVSKFYCEKHYKVLNPRKPKVKVKAVRKVTVKPIINFNNCLKCDCSITGEFAYMRSNKRFGYCVGCDGTDVIWEESSYKSPFDYQL